MNDVDKDAEQRKQQGARLRDARKAAGYSSARDAALSNKWKESSYRAHELGTRTIGQNDAEKYARRFRSAGALVTAQSILFGEMAAQPLRDPIRDKNVKARRNAGLSAVFSNHNLVGTFDPDEVEAPSTKEQALYNEGRLNVPDGEIPQVAARIGLGTAFEAATINVPLGSETVAASPIIDTWKIPESVLRRRWPVSASQVHIIECEGDSMEPRIRNGDFVFIDTSRRLPSPPGIFALFDGYGQTLKRIELVPNSDPPRVVIIPENPRHPSYERMLDEVSIIGRYLCRLTMD